ncbi:MAG: ATP-binding protein [Actinobacteria bacterium]|nr:ATP-binding protein [Actinomycetota bacterium]
MMGDHRGGPPSEPARPAAAAGSGPLVMDQAFDRDSLYGLREAVAAHAAQAGLSEGRVTDLVLAVHELASNAVRHGAGRGQLRAWNTGEALRCEVSDDGMAGAGADPASWEVPLWPVEQGHGLWLVRQVADRSSLDTGPLGTVAAVSFAFRPPGPVPFQLAERSVDGCVIVALTGQLDLGSAGRFTAVAGELSAGTRGLRLILDLAGLTVWDSTGLAALLAVQRRVSSDPGAVMVLAGLPGHLVSRLHDAGLAGRFTLAGDTGEAMGMAAPPARPSAPGRRQTPPT